MNDTRRPPGHASTVRGMRMVLDPVALVAKLKVVYSHTVGYGIKSAGSKTARAE
jgi:hypothetical protein